MKKFFSLVAIAAVAATMFTSCKDDEKPGPGPEPGKVALSLSVDKATLKAGEKGTFKVVSTIAAPADIVITVKSSAVTFVTVASPVTIKAGTKEISGEYVAVADGESTISIEATGVTLTTQSQKVTVGEKGAELEVLLDCNSSEPWSDQYFANDNSFGFTLWYNTSVLIENAGADYYGKDLALTAVDKGTDIAGLTMTVNDGHILMGTNKSEGYDQLPNFSKIGKAQYVVFCVVDGYVEPVFDGDGVITNPEAFAHTQPQRKGWALVTSDGGENVTLHAFKFPATKVGE